MVTPTSAIDSTDAVLSFDFGPPAPTFSDKAKERQYLKERLACGFRVLGRERLFEGASGHVTVRDSIDPSCFWVNPYGKHFSMMTASDLLLIDHSGKIVAGGKPERQYYNSAAFVIHAAIHTARPDVNAVCHSHTPYGKAFATLGRPFPFYTQDSASFWDDISLYDSHGGVVLSSKESARIVESMGNHKAIIMQNHGIMTVGGCVESAIAWFMLLENECRCILTAEASAAGTGKLPISIQPEVAKFTYNETGTEEAGRFEALPYFDIVEEETNGAYKA